MSSVSLHTTSTFLSEKRYLLKILNLFIGLECDLIVDDTLQNQYKFALSKGQEIRMEDCFFSSIPKGKSYLQEKYLPNNIRYFVQNFLPNKNLPVLFGQPNLQISDSSISCEIDVLGCIYFMLSRWEEIANPIRDKFDRFPASASIAHRKGFLNRPIVNEYCALLVYFFQKLGHPLSLSSKSFFKIRYSCDVDVIHNRASKYPKQLIKALAISMKNRYRIDKFSTNLKNYIYNINSYDTFSYIFQQLHQANVEGAFYFITDKTSNRDSDYEFQEVEISKLMRSMHAEGFEVGLHPSFETYQDRIQLEKEFQLLRRKAAEVGIEQKIWGGRQHFLKWDPKQTHKNWDSVGINYDSTLGYADVVGFRSGTCYDYPIFDPILRQELDLIERPLILMETSLIDRRYMNKGYSHEAYAIIDHLKEQCRYYGGNFNFLWHNSHFLIKKDKRLFEHCLSN